MYVYCTVTYSAVPYGGHFIIIIIICVCVREPQTTKQKIPTYLTYTTSCIITYSTFFILTHLFHTAVYASIFPAFPKPASIWNLKKKKSCPTSKP